MLISHEENSTAYAYDVTVTWYLMPEVKGVSVIAISNVKSYSNILNNTILTFIVCISTKWPNIPHF